MKCQTCGNDNPEDAKFCGGCGTNLISGEVSVGAELPMVGFGEAISRGFRNYATFSGRATRAERAARKPVKRRRAKKPSAVPNKIRINTR